MRVCAPWSFSAALLLVWFAGFLTLIPAPLRANEPPSFSHPAGFYTNEFALEIETTEPGGVIRYTLDGSEPTEQSPVYEAPLIARDRTGEPNDLSRIKTNLPGDQWLDPLGQVFKATVVRARVFVPGSPPGPVATRTYFVHPQMDSKYTLAIVSLATDRENFFAPDIGIYVAGQNNNFNRQGAEWERPVHVEFFEPDGALGFAQNMGARVHGGNSRRMRLKSLRLYARGEYDDENWIRYPVLPGLTTWPAGRDPLPRLKRLLLRSGGTDWGTDYGGAEDSWGATGMRDPFLQSLARDLPIDTQAAYRRVLVFLNGEYWGIHNVREVYHTSYFSERYGIDPQDVTILESNALIDTGQPGDQQHYQEMLDYIAQNGVHDPEHYHRVKMWMDVDNYIHYQAFQIYIGNFDWPGHNIKFWRKRTDGFVPRAPYGHDGRWRWLVYDVDLAAGSRGWSYTHNTLAHATLPVGGHSLYNPPWSTFLFRSLLENGEFRNRFINQLADHLNHSFREDRVLARLEEMRAEIMPEMLEHILRWRVFNTSGRRWTANVNQLAQFALHRPQRVREHVINHFQLIGLATLEVSAVNAHGGQVRINSLRIGEQQLPWEGIYFQGVPIEIEAVPHPGFRFAGWEGGAQGNQPRLILSLSNNVSLSARFEVVNPDQFPVPFDLSSADYRLERWDTLQPAGSYPPNMIFWQTRTQDPRLNADMSLPWDRAYNLGSRSRVIGRGADGFSFLNTGNPQDDNAGYLGAADLALGTIGQEQVWVSWRGATITPNNRPYAIRLQYRVGQQGTFRDVSWNGEPVEYIRNASAGHSETFGPLPLPPETANQSVVHLRWRYHALESNATGPRAELSVSDILVTAQEIVSPYERWLARYFSADERMDLAIAGLDADPDGDGISNRFEYAFGLNPTTPDRSGLPSASLITVNGGEYLAVTYTRNPEASDVAFISEVSADLQSWTAEVEPVQVMASETVETVVERDSRPLADSARRFIRVSIQMQSP